MIEKPPDTLREEMRERMTDSLANQSDQSVPPDTRGPAIVVTGSLLDGLKAHGPFDSIDLAMKWYEKSLFGKCRAHVTIMLLEKP